MTALWQAVKPTSDLVSGVYLALIMLGALWVLGAFVGSTAPKLIAWWERRRGGTSLPILTEARIVLLTLTMVWIVLLSLVIIGSQVYFGDEATLLPLQISPD